MVFNVGLIDFETTLLAKIEDQAKVVNLSRGIELIAGTCSHGSHGHTHTHGTRMSGHRPGHCRRWRKTPMRRSGKPIQTR